MRKITVTQKDVDHSGERPRRGHDFVSGTESVTQFTKRVAYAIAKERSAAGYIMSHRKPSKPGGDWTFLDC